MEWTSSDKTAGSPDRSIPSFPNGSMSNNNAPSHQGKNNRKRGSLSGFNNLSSIILLSLVGLLIIAVIAFSVSYRGDRANDESKFVAKDQMQAVFLNGGQVYFGKIRALNNKYVGLTDIFYLRVNQQVQPKEGEQVQSSNIDLVPLGCELHGPQNQMLINRDQVVFWENLKNDGKVALAVQEFKQKFPDGQKCEDPKQQATPSDNNQQQNSEQKQPTNNQSPQNNTQPNQ